jgi:site-specific DNA-methyltransferase (adenine-specific)
MIELKVIPITSIIVEERFREEYGDIDTLAASIKKEGIIQPLAVCARVDGSYRLLAGGRRIKACSQAGISEIPVRIYPATLSELEMRSIELMENIARKDMSWVEATNLKSEIHKLQIAIHGVKTSTSPDAPGQSKRDTAELLGVSVGGLVYDLKLAEAMAAFPQLKEAKTKGDAHKLLNRLEEEMLLQEISSRIARKNAITPIEIIRQKLCDSYLINDFFTGVRQIPNNSMDLIEIDPPYSLGLGTSSIKKTDDSMQTSTKNYNEIPVDQYVPFLDNLFKECYRVMSENSWLICWFAQEPWFEIVYQALRRVGLQGTRVVGIWNKENSPGQCNQPNLYLANTYEAFFYMRKGNPAITKQGRSNVYNYKTVASLRKIHPTERPVELIQEVLQTFSWSGARLLVPFLGSGNTLLAATNIEVSAIGFDLSQEYKNAYMLRVQEGLPGGYKSYRTVEEKDAL